MTSGPIPFTAGVSVNALAAPWVEQFVRNAAAFRVQAARGETSATIVDAGIAVPGGLEAGRRVAEICLGGLGTVRILPGDDHALGLDVVHVHTASPVVACLASQYAGWSLSHGEGKGAFRAVASGPGRALALREPLFEELGYADRYVRAVFVLEVDSLLPEPVVAKVAAACNLEPSQVTFILTPTRSLAGTVQGVARVLEVALHKAYALKFPLDRIIDGAGTAPIAPPAPDLVAAMGRVHDAILYGGFVTLYVDVEDDRARDLAAALPSSSSRDHGRSFARIFKDHGYDFYEIDPMLFAPAEVVVCNVATGRSFRAGGRDPGRLRDCFGL